MNSSQQEYRKISYELTVPTQYINFTEILGLPVVGEPIAFQSWATTNESHAKEMSFELKWVDEFGESVAGEIAEEGETYYLSMTLKTYPELDGGKPNPVILLDGVPLETTQYAYRDGFYYFHAAAYDKQYRAFQPIQPDESLGSVTIHVTSDRLNVGSTIYLVQGTIENYSLAYTHTVYFENGYEETITFSNLPAKRYQLLITAPKCTTSNIMESFTLGTDTYIKEINYITNHTWTGDCTGYLTCSVCGEISTELGAHSWKDATCKAPKTCTTCGKTEGAPVHNFSIPGSCFMPEQCSICGALGEYGDHDWLEATCEEPETCSFCGETSGTELGHDWSEATCTDPATCTVCGATDGTAPGHVLEDATCAQPKYCINCGTTKGDALGHTWNEATCTDPRTCTVCWTTEGDALGHSWDDTDCTKTGTCTACGETRGADSHVLTIVSVTDKQHTGVCDVCEMTVTEDHIPGEDEFCDICGAEVQIIVETKVANGWSGDLTWILYDSGRLVFSGTGNMKNYGYAGGQPWLNKGVDIASVVIPEGVVSVGSGAFRNLTTLKSVTFPATTLTKMGEAAFYGSGLESVEIPASLWTIQPYTFKNCTNLTSVKFHEGNLQKISDGAFYGTGLSELVLPDCLDILDVYAFKGCKNLTSITIGSGLTELREAVFYGTAIPTITIPEGITKIGPYVFKRCAKLETINLPGTLTSVGEAAFYEATALKTVELPDGVTTIGNYAFRKCAAIETLKLSAELVTVGECAFYGCTGLTELVIPDKVTTIKPYAFKTCTGLTSVTLGSKVATIGEGAFNTCTGLKTIVFPASLKTIGDYCFSGSNNLWKLTFQGDAPNIGTGAFKGMNAYAYYPAGNLSWTSAVMQNYGGKITWTGK